MWFTFYHIGKSLEVPPNNTLTLDTVNLENNDIVRVIADQLTQVQLM